MRLGVHAMTWCTQWSDACLPLIEHAAELELDFIEIPLMDLDAVHPVLIRRRLEAAGIEAVTSTALSQATDITSADAGVRAAGLDYLRRCVDAAVDMGASQLSGVIYGAHGTRPRTRPGEADWNRSAETLAMVADYAARFDVKIAVEPCNRYETPLINTCEQATKLVEMVGAQNLGIHLDTYHMNIEEKGWTEPVLLADNRLCHVHLSENDRGIPGSGLVDWEDLFRALGRIRYAGYAGMESFAGAAGGMVGDVWAWRDLAPSGDALVRQGSAFLRDMAWRHGL